MLCESPLPGSLPRPLLRSCPPSAVVRLLTLRYGSQGRREGDTLADFERDLADNLCYERGATPESASSQDAYWTLAVTVRDRTARSGFFSSDQAVGDYCRDIWHTQSMPVTSN
jgi:hypothetical protein